MFLMVLFAIRDIGGIAINPYLLTMIMSGIAIMLPYQQLVSYVFFMLPLSCGIQSFVWVVILGCLLLRRKKVPIKSIVLAMIFVLLELLDQAHHPAFDTIAKNTIFYFVSLFIVFISTIDYDTNTDHAQNVRYFIYGTAFLFIMIFGRVILDSGLDELLTGALRYKMDTKDLANDYVFFTNANNIGLYSATCVACLLIGIKHIQISKMLYVILFIIIVAGGALSFSRTWLLMSALSVVLFLALSPKNKKFVSALLFIVIAAVIVMNTTVFDPIYEVFETRLTSEDISDGAGRTDLFKLYHNFFSEHPEYWVTGTGAVYYLKVCAQPNSIHNMLQQIYIAYGLIGICVFMYYFVEILLRCKRFVWSMVQYIPFIVYIIFAQTLQFVNPIFCMYPLALVVACFYLKQYNNA